ncbi:MAG: hypothetical protein ACXVNF_02370, partial [Neobacillus sp.]
MAQKKNEAVSAANDNIISTAEGINAGGLFVDTFWDQYEQSSARVRQVRESQEDAYMKALREVIKFNKQYRNSLANLYEQSKKANQEIFTGILNQFTTFQKEQMNEVVAMDSVQMNESEELKEQIKEVSNQLEKLALTPIKSVAHLIDQLEDNFEKNAESSIEYSRERRNAWQQVNDEYVKLARNTHSDLVERGQNSLK